MRHTTSAIFLRWTAPVWLLACMVMPAFAAPLRATLTEGETRRYALEQTTTVTVFDQSTIVNSHFTYHLETTSVTEDGASVRITIESVRMRMSQGDTTIEYDSEQPADEGAPPNPLAGALDNVAGAEMSLRVAPSGEVVSIDDSVIRNNPVLMQLLDPESQRRSLSRLFRVEGAPEEINAGDAWSVTTTQDIDQMIGVQFTYTYAVEMIEEQRTTIDLSGEARLMISDENMPEELRPSLTLHELSGRVVWSAAPAALESYSVLTDFTLEGMNPQSGQRVAARLRQDQTLHRLKESD